MTEAAPPDVKRRRLSAADGDPHVNRSLSDLPIGILEQTASFLAAPSRALFAIALDENSTITPLNARSSAIVGNQWDTLDFGEIEMDLAEKLSDADIENVLLCIDAVNNVKRLKLADCLKITGAGLEPLRGSLIIQQIDLSLDGEHQDPNLDLVPPISCVHVLPILDSIIEREGCQLMHLQFPSVWLDAFEGPSTDSEFHAFILRYNQMYTNRGTVSCLECNEIIPRDGEEQWIGLHTSGYSFLDRNYGLHFYTCYGCLKHYCYDCEITIGCCRCRRDYCKDCTGMFGCSGCDSKFCHYCCDHKCVECDERFCSECENERIDLCDYCNRCYCRGCNDDEEVDIISTCSRCYVTCCNDCRLQRYRQGQQHCTDCIKPVAPSLVRKRFQRLTRKQLQGKYDLLKVEMEALRLENRELKLENEELRSKLT